MIHGQRIAGSVLRHSRRDVLAGLGLLVLGIAGPRAGSAQAPVAALPPFTDRIGELLALAPMVSDNPESSFGVAFTFVDLERQLASLGVARPSGQDVPEGFLSGIEGLPMASNAFQFAFTSDWPDTFGFEPLSVGRVLEVGEPPDMLTFFAGIDPDRVRAALVEAGYQEIDQETGGDYLTFGDELNLQLPVGRLGVGAMNQAAIREDVAIFTREEPAIQQATQVIAGNAPSLLEAGGWPALMATFADDVVGLVALYPTVFEGIGDAQAIEQLAFGIREGSNNRDIWEADDRGEELPVPTAIADFPATRARVQVRIRYRDEATARAEAEAIPRRWGEQRSLFTEQPLTDLMLVEAAGVAEEDPTVAAIDFRVRGAAGWWHQLIYRADLAAFVPAGQDEEEAPDATPIA